MTDAKTELPTSRQRWATGSFERALKHELRQLQQGTLPLAAGTTQGGMVDDSDISVTVLNSTESIDDIIVRVSVFFSEIVGGCNCHDDPVSENAHCNLLVTIDKVTALAKFEVLADK